MYMKVKENIPEVQMYKKKVQKQKKVTSAKERKVWYCSSVRVVHYMQGDGRTMPKNIHVVCPLMQESVIDNARSTERWLDVGDAIARNDGCSPIFPGQDE